MMVQQAIPASAGPDPLFGTAAPESVDATLRRIAGAWEQAKAMRTDMPPAADFDGKAPGDDGRRALRLESGAREGQLYVESVGWRIVETAGETLTGRDLEDLAGVPRLDGLKQQCQTAIHGHCPVFERHEGWSAVADPVPY